MFRYHVNFKVIIIAIILGIVVGIGIIMYKHNSGSNSAEEEYRTQLKKINSEYISNSSEKAENTLLPEVDVSAVRDVAGKILEENHYSECVLVSVEKDTISGKETGETDYVICMDGTDYWVIVYDGTEAYAIQDKWGIYSTTEE